MNCELMLTYDTPAYMYNVYKNQLSRQTGSRNLTGPKTLPTIWHTPIWSLWPNIRFLPSIVAEKNATKNILDGRTDRGKTVYPPPVDRGYNYLSFQSIDYERTWWLFQKCVLCTKLDFYIYIIDPNHQFSVK